MSKIAIKLNDDRNIIGYASESTAEAQSKYEGWTLVDSDPAFSIDNMFSWTVRESDNVLVHISTGMAPNEESTQANALLGKNVGKALAQADIANTAANNAMDLASKSVAANAEIGKLIAPLLAAHSNTTNTDGGTN